MIGRFFIALVAVSLLQGCTSSPKTADDSARHYQQISVMTPGVTGAHCFLQSGGTTYTAAANSRVTVRRAPDDMAVSCFKGPHMAGHTSVKPTVAPREAAQIFADRQGCESCTYPESIHVVLALRPQSVEKNNIRIMQ